MKNTRTELSQRVQYALLAGMAGAFLIPQVGFAAPSGADYDKTTITINQTSDLAQTDITSTKLNNVINWRDYSVKQGETVQYDGGVTTGAAAHNYLNIVTGANTSNIDGTIKGGNHVYIVNPNGVIFGKSAEVNVGHLHVSTQNGVAVAAKTAFETGGTSPLDNTAALKSDVVNMGTITANTVEVHGKNIRFLNAADVTATNRILYTDTANGGYAHIGYEKGHTPASTDYTINGANAVAADNYYQLVSTKEELAAINDSTATLVGNYMLANDIDLENNPHTPLGKDATDSFKGKFDGNFFRIENIKVSGVHDAGLFGVLDGARIDNVGVVNGTVSSTTSGINSGTSNGEYAGGIAGKAFNSKIYNVYTKDTKVDGNSFANAGLVGYTYATTIDGAYSKAKVGVDGVGIVGIAGDGTKIKNAYSAASYITSSSSIPFFLGGAGLDEATIEDSYTNSRTISSTDNTIESKFKNVFGASATAGYMENLITHKDLDAHASSTYTGWDINNDGAPGAKWRIYEGRTLPLLTAFMNGRVDSVGSVGANYSYRKFNQTNGFAVAGDANKDPISNNHADITGLTYDSKIVKIVDGSGNVGDTSKVTYDKTLTGDQKNTVKMYTDTGTPLSKTDNIRNAGTKAILWSDQDGPNLRNVNVTIGQRNVTVENSNITVTRRYNGKKAVTNEYNAAIRNGGITAGGITPEDIADGSVTITTSTDFKAEMDDKNVGENKAVTLYGSLTFAGTDQSNYKITQSDFNFGSAGRRVDKVATITPAPLILDVLKDSTTKIYNGTDAVTDPAMKANPNVRINETLTMTVGGNTVTADIKTDEDSHNKDDVSMDTISDPTYVKADGSAEIHAGDNHTIRYKNVKLKGSDAGNYELYYKLPSSSAPERVTGDKLDLKGTITPRGISTKDFKVYKRSDHLAASAERVYDGTDSYKPGSDVYLSSNVGASTAPDTGIVDRDRNKITFGLVGDKAYFTKDDNATKTSHVSEAKRITYNIKAATTDTDAHRLSDYYYTVDGTTKVGELTDAVVASGEGRITPKALTAEAKKDLNKIYDGMAEYTDGSQNVKRGDEVVTFTGWTSDSDKRTNESTATYVNASNADDANVAYAGTAVTTKNIKYTAKLTGQYADDYAIQKIANTVISTATNSGTPNVAVTADLGVEANAGTISPRDVQVTFKNVTKVYDGTANNNKIEVDSLDDKLSGRVFAKDGTNTGSFSTAGITSRYGTKGTPFVANVNASDNPYDVEYANISNPLGGNYRVDSTLYGTGTITRRRIDPDGFQVLRKQSDGTYQAERITKTYDGTSTYTLPDGAYLRTPTVTPTPSDKTGIIEADKDKIRFRFASNTHGTFQKTDGTETTHVSEAKKVAYQVVAYGVEGSTETDEPLKNYTFGTAAEETTHTLKNLENLKEGKTPAAVLADGSITPAKIVAETVKNLNKTYDGVTGYTKGDQNTTAASVTGENVIKFKHLNQDGSLTDGLINDASRMPVNSSTAAYVDKNVLYNTQKEPVAKAMHYTAKLTGTYADDYEIVDANHPNTKLSTMTESGGTKNVSTVFNNVADAGTISPRKLKITMENVEKTYDGTSTNASATVTGITDDPASTVINTILSGDSITAGTLQTTYRGMLTANTASSTYGRFLGTNFTTNANASNGTPHDVQYTNMNTAFSTAFGGAAGNYTVDALAYGKGTINRKAITPNTFKVSGGKATKVYDGTSAYTVPAGSTLTANMGELVGTDASKIQFAISGNGAKFMKTDGVTETANVADARKVAYNITVSGDSDTIRNYTLNGQNLESGNLTASGGGSITRRALNLNLVQSTGIDKEYDGQTTLKNTATKNWNALTDANPKGNVQYAAGSTAANKLVTTDGTSFNITSNYMNNAGTVADKNVRRDGSNNPIDKTIQYRVTINGDANNYSFDGGTTSAAGGLTLSATGSITPKDLSGAFKKVTKVYDGTKNVPASQVGLESGINGVVSGDTVELATHTESFQSENVNGDGVNTWTPTEGTEKDKVQKNWINYSGLTLGGADAGNYKLASTAQGLGEITPFVLNDGSITFTKRQAEKVYDGTKDVKYGDLTGDALKKRHITSAKVTVGTAPPVDILDDLELKEAQYDSKDVVGGTQPRVTYRLSYRDPSGKGNFSLKTGVTSFTTKGDGIITPKDVNVTVKSPLTKTYDATENVTVGTVKNAAGETVNNLNDNLALDGLVAGDGTTYTTTAEYGKKNASDIAKNTGTDKRINYTLTLTSNAGNYNLKYNGVDNAGAFSTNNNTITKRKVDVQFKNPPARTYNGSAENTAINPFVSSADAAVLRKDKQTLISGTDVQNLAGISSKYVQNDRVTEDPNAGKDKLVRFDNVRTAMNNALGSDASNYEFNETAYAKGTINKANIDTSKITFRTSGATKTYDGTDRVKYNGSSASDAVKNYITEATAHLGGGHTANLRGDLVIDEKETRYESSNAGTGIGVKYKFRLNNSNIEISGKNEFEMPDTGEIKRRVLNLDLTQKTGIDKIYDANAKLLDTNTRHYDKFTDDDALGNVTYAAGTTDDNKLVRTSNGASVNDGATMTIRANYVNAGVADKNVARDGSGNVAAKDIAYRVSIDAANGGQNYKLSDGVTTVDAETGLNLSARGTITPRELTLGFADVSKPYDTTAINATKNISNVAADERDGRGAATLTADGITAATFSSSTGGVTSLYGTGNTDATFHKDPNVVTDANGNVIERGKDVQYANVRSVLTGALANNYTVADTAYGKGTIRKRSVSVNNFNFNISNATKEYDGTKDVEYVEGGKTYKDLPHLKKRFQTSTLDLGGGNIVPINLDDITLTGAKYNDERVAHATGINYDVTINAQNFEFNGGRDKRIEHTGDTITKRDLATKLPPHLVKEYDGEDSFTETNTVFANAMARANLTGVVDRDKNKIRLAVNGHYDSPDASTETREEAEARTPAQAGRNVHYDLTLSGDTDTLSNYKIGTVETLDSDGKMRGVGSGKADIYKKTLTVGVDNIDKLYDGTRTVVRPNGTDTLPHPEAGKFRLSGFVGSESFSFDQTAADKIDGLYSDPNVSRRNGAVVDKDISYSGIKTAFANYAGHDPTGYAKNYRVDSDTLSGKGKILPRPITANEITNGLKFDEATKVYDGTTKLKYNGQNTPDALKNYLKSATVNVDGTPINIRDDLTIRADEAYTHYDTQHVAGGAQPRVTYTLNYTGDNFDISGDLTKTANGVITKRKVTAFAPGQLTKVYDASEKVYDPRDTSIKTYRRGTRVTDGDSIVRMSTEDGDTGLLANDGVRNISTATFDDKNVGKRKKVTYNVAVDSTHAGDYEIVDTLGNTISELTTRNNEITPRPLDLTFDRVDKDYDGTSTNEDMPAARVTNSDTRRTLGRDRARIFNDELIMQDAAGNDLTLPSDYGYGSTDRSFTPDANANQAGEPDKSVQYRNMGDALRTILGDNAKNYEFKETGYGKGWINKAKVSERDFRLNFKDAVREYDGTSNVDHAIDNLQDDSRWKSNKMLKSDIASVTGTYMSPNGSTPDKNAADRKIVDYKVRLNNRNFDFGSWDGVVSAEAGGAITKRKIIAETPRYLTKEYDGTKDIVGKAYDAEGNRITSDGDGLITFRHYNETAANKYDAADGLVAADTAGNTVRNATTALYADKNVAWKGGAWKNGHGDVADKDVNYALTLTGTDAKNYEIMNEVVNKDGTKTKAIVGKGKITPRDIHLKADPQTRWINEGLPKSYTGKPMGSNLGHNDIPELLPNEVLPGSIDYSSPNARLRWGDYMIRGDYHALNGTDGDAVSRNYRFVQDPANASAFHMGPYVPDYEYYKAMTQVSKMTPDEYAYENASLDRRRSFGRDSEAEIAYTPPSINTIKDGVDITQTGIHVTDETVFSLVNEVFGGK